MAHEKRGRTLLNGKFGNRGLPGRAGATAAIVALLGLMPLTSVLAQLPDEPSPENGTAQVVAQGVVEVGADDVKWRIADRTALPPANAQSVVSDLGFVVVDSGVMLVEDLDSGEQQRLAAGEVMLSVGGAEQARVALGSDRVTYRDLALVDGGSDSNLDGAVIYESERFAGPGARLDLDLLQDVLAPGGAMELPGGSLPGLLLIANGGADVTTESGDVLSLGAGEAISLSGPLLVTGTESGATVTAIYAGPTVPRLTRASGTPMAGRAVETTTQQAAVAPAATPAATSPTRIATEDPDDDGDGLTLSEEVAAGTDSELADTDEDGLTDGQETAEFGTNPLLPDTDVDGVLDGDEVALGSDPNDSAPGGETAAPVAGEEDVSTEGAPVDEVAATPGDSDGDGLEDAIEVELGTDPLDTDTDDDGLTDGAEYYTHATGTRNPDSDGDGIVDGDEIANGTNPNDASSS